MQIMPQTHTHEAVTGRVEHVEAKKLLSCHLRQSHYTNKVAYCILEMGIDLKLISIRTGSRSVHTTLQLRYVAAMHAHVMLLHCGAA